MIVVADTSVLINLCRVRQGDLLKSLFHEVVIPPEVAAEFSRLATTVPRFASLSLPPGVRLQAPAALMPANPPLYRWRWKFMPTPFCWMNGAATK